MNQEVDDVNDIQSLINQSNEKEAYKQFVRDSANELFAQIEKDPKSIIVKDKKLVAQNIELCDNFIKLFVESEEYEKCALAQLWKTQLEKIR